jgi:hypothetical protein
MADKLYHSKKTGERLGIVLDEFESESAPGTFHQIRTSDADGRTYCTCQGWVGALNRMRKLGLKGEARCKHIEDYRRRPDARPMVIHDFDSFASVRRGIHIKLTKKTLANEVVVQRPHDNG